jgi:hypothetical protein
MCFSGTPPWLDFSYNDFFVAYYIRRHAVNLLGGVNFISIPLVKVGLPSFSTAQSFEDYLPA